MSPPEFRGPVRALLSYAYFREEPLDRFRAVLTEDDRPPSLISDSGAFTAHTLGFEVTPRDYGTWLQRWGWMFDYCITLDVIGDTEASWHSHQTTQQLAGRKLVPVVHFGEPLDTFDRYRNDHRLIGVGGLAIRDRYHIGKRYRWLIDVFRWAEANDARLHGLGIGSWRNIWELPWWAVDTSNWSRAMHWAKTDLFDPATGRMIQVRRTGAEAHREYTARILRARGVDPRFLARDFNRYLAGSVSVDSYRRAEVWVRQRRGVIPPPDDAALSAADGTGLRISLAMINFGDATMLVGSTDAPSRGGLERRWVPAS